LSHQNGYAHSLSIYFRTIGYYPQLTSDKG